MINIRMQPQEVRKLSPKLAVIGVGGAGGNAVNNMISSNLEGVEFIVCNSDAQALEGSLCPTKIQLGEEVTGGLGAGARPDIGRAAAEESIEDVMSLLEGANMVFITAGMGGGTGTGAAPIIAKACREHGILTVGVVTKPFHFEGTQRMRMAEEGIEQMQQYVDTLIVIPNQNLFRVANEKTTFSEAFKMADSVLQSGVRGVTDLMVMPGLINLDFADVRVSMMDQGKAMLGTGEASGERRAIEAAESAINNPLLDDVSMKGAKGVIINITGGYDMTLFEADEACNRIREEVDPEANIIFGSTFDESLDGAMRVSVIATGIDQMKARKPTGFDLNKATTMIKNTANSQTLPQDKSEPVEPKASTTAKANVPAYELARSIKAPAEAKPAPVTPATTEKAEDPENEMFEQHTFHDAQARKQDAQDTAARGSRYKDAFIPPKPVEVDKSEYVPHNFGGAALTQEEKPAPTPVQYSAQPASAPATPAPVEKDTGTIGYTLTPPVPAHQRQEASTSAKKSPSLFERITGMGGHGRSEGGGKSPSVSMSSAPQQGSLAIDSPAAAPKAQQEETDLEIPAFLRRQAN